MTLLRHYDEYDEPVPLGCIAYVTKAEWPLDGPRTIHLVLVHREYGTIGEAVLVGVTMEEFDQAFVDNVQKPWRGRMPAKMRSRR